MSSVGLHCAFCILGKTNCYGSQGMECRRYSKWMVRSDQRSQATVRTVGFPTSAKTRQGQFPRRASRTLAQSFTTPSRCFPQSPCQSRRGSRDRLCQGEAISECHQRARREGPIRCKHARGIADGPFQGTSRPVEDRIKSTAAFLGRARKSRRPGRSWRLRRKTSETEKRG